MKMLTFKIYRGILRLLLFAGIAVVFPAIASAQDDETDFDAQFEKTSQLIAMLKADYDGVQEFGAGIIFGRQKDRLLIATAYHILQRGPVKPGKILITLRAMPDKLLEASVLKHSDDGGSDLAVLAVDSLAKQGLDVCALSFDRLGDPAGLKRRDSVYPVGNPTGVSWAIPPEADKVSQLTGNNIVFQSSFISSGHSGGGLLDKNALLVGMIVADQPPFGRARNTNAILKQVRLWGYPVQLLSVLPQGSTPLHIAADSGNVDAIKNILEICNGNVNARDDHKSTPLHFAANNGNTDAISILLKAGADVNAQDADGDTPLYWALEKDDLKTVKYLITAGAKINIKNILKREAIHFAQTVEIERLLIASGADINATDAYQYTPLQNAASSADIERIKLLINAGADVNKTNEYGESPLSFIVKKQSEEGMKIIIKAGANVNVKGTFGYTPLMTAAIGQWKPGITFLLNSGADMNAVNESGQTALTLAISHGYPKIADFLRSLGAKY